MSDKLSVTAYGHPQECHVTFLRGGLRFVLKNHRVDHRTSVLKIVPTLDCLRKAPKTEGLDKIAGKNVTVRGRTENGTLMATLIILSSVSERGFIKYILLVDGCKLQDHSELKCNFMLEVNVSLGSALSKSAFLAVAIVFGDVLSRTCQLVVIFSGLFTSNIPSVLSLFCY